MSKQRDAIKSITGKYVNMKVGESGENGMLYISSKQSLGRTEIELVKDMFDAINELIKKEKSLN